MPTTTSHCSAQAQPFSYIALAHYPFAVQLLDVNLNVIGSLPFNLTSGAGGGGGYPNGIATDGQLIYIAVANSNQLQIIDYMGMEAGGWVITPSPNYGVFGMDFVNGDLAIGFVGEDCMSPIVRYYDKSTGILKTSTKVYIGDVDNCPEALAYDGTTLWMFSNTIDGYDPNVGTTPTVQLTNPAAGGVCDFQGTGLAFDAATNSLIIGCNAGQWFHVSIATGEVIGSGNNGLEMLGLKATNC